MKPRSEKVLARVFMTGRSQAVRLPRQFRFATDTVLVHREGETVVVEPANTWPAGWVASFTGVPADFERPAQGEAEQREKVG